MNVLIAGASGSIGKNFILRCPRHWQILGLYHQNSDFLKFLATEKLNHVTACHCDLRNLSQVQETFKNKKDVFDVCLFVLGNSDIGLSMRDPLKDVQDNLVTLINLITNTRIKKFIFTKVRIDKRDHHFGK